MNTQDLDTLARTMYGEAEARNILDATAVAAVVLNRVKHKQWPNSVAAVCKQPWQFSCWNPGDPNRERIMNADSAWFEKCKDLAARVMTLSANGKFSDPTNGATHYYATYVKAPKWAKGHKPCYEVLHKRGAHKHIFFNDIDTPAPTTAREALNQKRPIKETRTVQGGTVAAGATIAGVAAENIEKLAPAVPLLQTIAEYAPWVMFVITLAAIGYIIYARIDDRAEGLR